jgi:hypothetical protein
LDHVHPFIRRADNADDCWWFHGDNNKKGKDFLF